MRYLILLAALALAGCATTMDPNHAASIQAYDRSQQQDSMQLAALADTTACQGDARCIENKTALAALAWVSVKARAGQQAPQYVRQAGAVERITLAALGFGERVTPSYFGYKSQQTAIEGNVEMARINAGRELGMIEAVAGTTNSVAQIIGLLPPGTAIEVQGDYIPGTQTVVGRDQIGRDQHIGDWRTGDDTRRDTIGGDRTDTDYGTGNRLNSPGPYRDTGNTGQRCTGIGCQTTNPLPEPEEPEDE
jgi:hypothetical protein